MKRLKILLTLIAITQSTLSQAQEIKPTEVKKVMQKVADWQIAHYNDLYSDAKKPHHPLDWTNGALYVGMVKWAAMADDNKYYDWLKEIGEKTPGNCTEENTMQTTIPLAKCILNYIANTKTKR